MNRPRSSWCGVGSITHAPARVVSLNRTKLLSSARSTEPQQALVTLDLGLRDHAKVLPLAMRPVPLHDPGNRLLEPQARRPRKARPRLRDVELEEVGLVGMRSL